MEEAWERAVEAAMDGEAEPRALTLDGAVKCLQGRLPPPALLERFQKLERLSIANVGVSSLEKFPRLRNLRCLSLSDNRIASGLEFLVDAGLDALRDLDLSNNRIGSLEDLAPLARLRLVSLDLYECPVTRIKDYRSKVFAMIRSLKYLDKMDTEENERPESDDDEEDDEDEDEDDDLGNGEVNGEENGARRAAGNGTESIIDVDEEEESEADEDMEYGGILEANESNRSRAFQVTPPGGNREEEEEEDDPEEDVDGEEDDDDFGEEIDEEDDEDEEDDVVEVHEIEDSDEDDDGDDGDDDDDDDEDDEEEEEDEDGDEEPGSNSRVAGAEGMINGHDHRKEDEQVVEDAQESEEDDMDDGEDEEEDLGAENYLLQPIAKPDREACNKEAESGEDRVDAGEDDSSKDATTSSPSSFLHPSKRKRDNRGGVDDNDAEDSRSSKHR